MRGGFGMFSDRSIDASFTDVNPPVVYTPTIYYESLNTYTQQGGALGPTNMAALYGRHKPTRTMNFSAGVQQQIGRSSVGASYVGNLGRYVMGITEMNATPMYTRFDRANKDPTQPGRPLPDQFLRPYRGYQSITAFVRERSFTWGLSGIATFMTGAPFTPGISTTDGQDITGSSESARITVTGNTRLAKSEKTFFRNFNTEAFGRTPLRSFGNAGVNFLNGPGINNWDLAVSKDVALGAEGRSLRFRAELYNGWNHTQFSNLFTTARFDPAGRQTDPNFGAFSAARDPRTVQFSLRPQF